MIFAVVVFFLIVDGKVIFFFCERVMRKKLNDYSKDLSDVFKRLCIFN